MWPWKRREADDRLGTLSRRLDDAESTLRMLKQEWLDTLDRLERMVGRIAKRAQRDAAPLGDGELAPPPDGTPPRPASAALVEVLKRRGGRV